MDPIFVLSSIIVLLTSCVHRDNPASSREPALLLPDGVEIVHGRLDAAGDDRLDGLRGVLGGRLDCFAVLVARFKMTQRNSVLVGFNANWSGAAAFGEHISPRDSP